MSEVFNLNNSKLFLTNEIEFVNKEVSEYLKSVVLMDDISNKIDCLIHLRSKIYEKLNQIQHEYYLTRAIEILYDNKRILNTDKIFWNPRQTGGSNEPDVRVIRNEKVIFSCELTTSTEAKGMIDQRMKMILEKLGKMEGEKIYFVISRKMKTRAETKIKKMALKIIVVNVNEWKCV